MMVSTASRMVRAISLGVFWRLAPSTSVIMRSKKVWPRSAVMRTTMRSERTLVPPVTAERSPPDSRITGADSPVMADSSTEATPTTTSPSPGTNSDAETTTMSPTLSFDPGTSSNEPSGFMRLAMVSRRAFRNVSACALPRPSAIASAKFANSKGNQSHRGIWSSNPKFPLWRSKSLISSTLVTTEPTSTTNITGFFISVRGFSLTKESFTATAIIPDVHSDFFPGVDVIVIVILKNLSCVHQQVLKNWSQAQSGEKCQRADDQHHTDQQRREQRGGYREASRGFRNNFLASQTPCNRENWNHHEKSSQQHVERHSDVVPRRVPVAAAEC